MKTKLLTTLLAAVLAVPSFGCWYAKKNYNDYIFGINNFERHTSLVKSIEGAGTKINQIEYTVQNGMKVDLPLTVTMKITSEEPIRVDGSDSQHDGQANDRVSPVTAKLQYRILPNGNWVTVSEFEIQSGRLPNSYPPAPYLGRNNVNPKGLKKGDKFLVRLYVTDNAGWQSGDLASLCDEKSSEGKYWYDYGTLRYTVTNMVKAKEGDGSNLQDQLLDMGGAWYPHYVVMLEYSGYQRPVQ